jgi:8-oxo-dGTP diphosphatase
MMVSCADAIAIYKGEITEHYGKLVLVERLKDPKGLALPGGHKEAGEGLEGCIDREFPEETGLSWVRKHQFHTYSAPGRDPRGEKESTVFIGEAYGTPCDEPAKTRVVFIDLEDVDRFKEHFAFDHYQIIKDWMMRSSFF